MVGTLAVVFGATLLTVGYLNIRTARETQDNIEAQIRQSITRKGQGLATNHALALRGLVADNAFGDVGQLVESAVRQDREMVYGLFLGADGRPWTYVPPLSPRGELDPQPSWRQLGIAPGESLATGIQSRQRVIEGQRVFEFSASVDSDDGAVLGRIFYGLSSVPLDHALVTTRHDFQRSLVLTLLLLGGLGGAAMLLGVAIIHNLSRRITGPLAHLTDVITAIAGGHKNERVVIESDDEIGTLGQAFNRMLEKLDDSYLRLEALNHTLERRVNDRTAELGQRNRDMRLVLDNVNQGFLTISRSGHLAQERSLIVDSWFGSVQESDTFWDYMWRVDRGFAELFHVGFEALLDDVLPKEMCLAQLPARARVDGRDFSFSYRSIGDPPPGKEDAPQGLLIVANDITERLLRARHDAEQSELLAMLRGFTSDRGGFLSFFEEAGRIVESLGGRESDLPTRRRLYHTLKGNAAMAGFGAVADLCHQAEDKLDDNDEAAVHTILEVLGNHWQALEEVLSSLLRERGRDVLEVHARDLEEVLVALREVAPTVVWERMADWRLEPAERPLTRLGDYARSLAKRLGRGDLEVIIDAGGVRLDPQRWIGLWAELVHIVRNAVDHGMEPIEERRAGPKEARPRLRLHTRATGDKLIIEIADDGKGIDWTAVRKAAAGKGLQCESTEELTAALLGKFLTTRAAVTATSGRGVGLASVRDRVQALGGGIAIITTRGQGTTFQFTFPLSAAPATPAEESNPTPGAPRATPTATA
ncbi:MAG TPA: ATP-binding protein [Polyangia bacterium]|jgi:signal transduction histidine kinase|nr:ATP-binding protein [Polyangia bacterium]